MESIDLNKWEEDIKNPESDIEHLFDQIKEGLNHSPDNVDYLWRASRVLIALADASKLNKDKQKEKSLNTLGVSYAKKAIELNPQCFEAHMFYCASVGRMADLVGIKERIQCGYEFQKHSQIAFALNSESPHLPVLYYMYGLFCYKICSISWIERKIATTLFGALPQTTYEEALAALHKANDLHPNDIPTHLWISEVLITQKKYSEAITWIERGLALEAERAHEFIIHEELLELKSEYSKYKPC